MPVQLDPRAARPLTSHEIAKVLMGMLGGVVTQEPGARADIPKVIEFARPGSVTGIRRKSWHVAFSATVAGLRGWCDERDVNTALSWISENYLRAIPGGTPVTPIN